MKIHYSSICQEVLLGFLVLALFFSGNNFFCHASTDKTIEVVGVGECADCKDSNIKIAHAFSGLRVTVDCKSAKGEFETRGVGELDNQGNFKVSLPQEIVKDGKLQEECYAQLHSASLAPCAVHNKEASKIIFRSTTDDKHTFGPTGKLKFSSAICTSAFLWPHYKYPPLPTLPPIKDHPWFKKYDHPWFKPLPPTVPVYKPAPVPVYKPKPKPPVYKPSPVPVYKPEPKPPVYKPAPIPVYKPEPKPKPPVYKPTPVPVYKPKPKPPVYKPTPVPVYKPKPKPKPEPKPKPPVYKPTPVPVYKPKPTVPIYKPLPPIPKIPPFYKKPCPPLPPLKFPPFSIPPKVFHHPKFGGFPPLPPHFPHT